MTNLTIIKRTNKPDTLVINTHVLFPLYGGKEKEDAKRGHKGDTVRFRGVSGVSV
jgi:hypothetical protein